jgi:hypothetical protein
MCVMLYELDELEMFRQYVADNVLEFLAHKPERLQDLFDHLRAYYRDSDRLVALDEIEAMAQNIVAPQSAHAPIEKRRRKHKPSLDKLLAKAKAAGASSVLVDGVEMRFGEPGAAATSSNPWDEVLSRDTH